MNLKVWLALRAGRGWLKRYRRHRFADAVVSMTFFAFIVIMIVVVTEVLAPSHVRFPSTLVHWELLVWWLASAVYLLRFMMLGMRINGRYHNTSVLLTEQMNLQLRILNTSEKEKRDRLAVSNKVLELAIKLLKEFDSPNRISGISMDPMLYNVTRVILLSALSAALSEFMGFDIKMFKVRLGALGVGCSVFGVRCSVFGVRCRVLSAQCYWPACPAFLIRTTPPPLSDQGRFPLRRALGAWPPWPVP